MPTIEPACPLPARPTNDALKALDQITAIVAATRQSATTFALSILDSTTGKVGLFTGRVEYDAENRRLLPEVAYTAPSEGEALAQCWRAPNITNAARAAGLLVTYGPIGLDIQIVEIRGEV